VNSKKGTNPVARYIGMAIFDGIAVNTAYWFAFILRFYVKFEFQAGADSYLPALWKAAPYYALVAVAIFYVFKLYHTRWEYAGIRDVNRLFFASICASAVETLGTLYIFGELPISVYFLGAGIQFGIILISRMIYKIYLMERNQRIFTKSDAKNVIVVGVDEFGRFAIKQNETVNGSNVVAAMDIFSSGTKQLINGVPILTSIDQMIHTIKQKKVGLVIIADSQLTDEQKKKIATVCDEHEVEVQDFIEYLQNNNNSESAVSIPKTTGARVIPFSPPDISDMEINEVKKALKSGWITTGPRTKELEKRLAEFCGTSKVVCLNSATAAEELNFRVCGIGPNDEVIVPAYTYTASASAAIHCGAKVIFVDSAKDSAEMDYEKMAEAITEKTKAIVAVDLGGIIANYDKIFEVVERKKALFHAKEGTDLGARIQQAIGRVIVFADCAHALGASKNGVMAGAIADFTDFSFHAVKNFTTAEGGASTWRDIPGISNDEMYKQYQLYSLHGQSKDALAKTQVGAWEYDIIGPWYKCNMTDIMAAIGLRQLDRYPGLMARRKEIIRKYDVMCDELGVKHLIHYTDDASSSGHLYLTRIPGITDAQRREIITRLAERGVNTNVHYKPLPMMTAYKELGWDIKDFPNAYDYYANLITLPLHTKLSDDDVEYVVEIYRDVVRAYIS